MRPFFVDMEFNCGPYNIEIFNDDKSFSSSKDNTVDYNIHYDFAGIYQSVNGVVIKVIKDNFLNVAIITDGHGVSINSNSVIADANAIFICYGANIYSLDIPSLAINWKQEVDIFTCFAIYPFEDDMIVHGELSVSRLSKRGFIKWQFSAGDIFVTPDGEKENFHISHGLITVVDWNKDEYVLNGEGTLINIDSNKQERANVCKPLNK